MTEKHRHPYPEDRFPPEPEPIAYIPAEVPPAGPAEEPAERPGRWWLGLFVVPVVFTACLGLITWSRHADLSGHSGPAQPFVVHGPATRSPSGPAVEPTQLTPIRPRAIPEGSADESADKGADKGDGSPKGILSPADTAKPGSRPDAKPGPKAGRGPGDRRAGPSERSGGAPDAKPPRRPKRPEGSRPPKADWKGPQGQHVGPGKPGDPCADFSEAQKPYCRAYFGLN